MLLRQTQAVSIAKIWEKFIWKYPNVQTLAEASENELEEQLKILGLGKQRSFALITVADWVLENNNGEVPLSKEDLLKIPHVGAYVSNAVLCFAFGQRTAIVDTNILRFYARYYGIEVKPDIRRNPQIWEIAQNSLPENPQDIKSYNYGLLDFTSEICRSKVPQCNICPLATTCKWGVHSNSLNKVQHL